MKSMHTQILNTLDPDDVDRSAIAAIPRRYNFAEDVLARNLTAGRGSKPAYIDRAGPGAMVSLRSGSLGSAICCAVLAFSASNAS